MYTSQTPYVSSHFKWGIANIYKTTFRITQKIIIHGRKIHKKLNKLQDDHNNKFTREQIRNVIERMVNRIIMWTT